MSLSSFFFGIIRFLWRFIGLILTTITILGILLALHGHIIRDPSAKLGLLMYIPLIPLGIWTILVDLIQGGRSLFLFRFSLTLIGLSLITWGYLTMVGQANVQAIAKAYPDNTIKVLHWNISWGGKGKNIWQQIRNEIQRHNPDIAILNETPKTKKFKQLLTQMGWKAQRFYNYEVRRHNPLAVCSATPVTIKKYIKIRNAYAVIMEIMIRNNKLRILAVDGNANVSKRHKLWSRRLILPKWRMPMLNDLAEIIKEEADDNHPIDIIAGDFNALSLSIGFDKFATAGGGYYLASRFSQDWRGTWKTYFPLYDIDHVWVHKRFQGLRTKLFSHSSSDHRGQIVKFVLPINAKSRTVMIYKNSSLYLE